MKPTKLVLKACGTFYIRAGWLEKALHAGAIYGAEAFSNRNGVAYLGVGANMVPSIRFWLKAAGLIDSKNELSETSKAVIELDPYMESSIVWWFIHYWLATNEQKCPVFYYFMNEYPNKFFSKEEAFNAMYEYFFNEIDQSLNKASLESDFSTFLTTYCQSKKNIKTPEDNLYSPLSKLGLLKQNADVYCKQTPSFSSLPPLFVYYVLRKSIDKSFFDIDEALKEDKGVGKILNLDRDSMFHYLDNLRKRELVTLNMTAGMNLVYFNSDYLPDVREVISICMEEQGVFDEII